MRVRAWGLPVALAVAALAIVDGGPALADDRFALIVTGASGGPPYAEKYDAWRRSLVATLRGKFGHADNHVIVLAETESQGVRKATRENVRRALAELHDRVTKDDLLLVMLIGHGTSLDGEDGKFNLVGPDLSATEWADLVKPLSGRLVFIDASSASFPFMRRLARPGRVVLTATDSSAQQFETVFPEFFLRAVNGLAADLDKNGRVSLWEAFSHASAGIRQSYEQKGQLPTERPLLDDDGDGIGREAQTPGPDSGLARAIYLEPDVPIGVAPDSALASLLERRAQLEAEVEALRARKPTLSAGEYDAALERVLVELARVSARIRAKS
jgi:hypothetical protein